MSDMETPVSDAGPELEVSEPASTENLKSSKDLPATDLVQIRVNGKMVEMTREKALLLAQKGYSADEKFREAAEAKKQADELLGAAKQKEFLRLAEKAGMTKIEAREALEQTLLKLYEEEALSPEERELRELRQLKEQKAAEEKARKEAEEQERLTKEEQKYLQQIEHEMVEALEKSILPPQPIFAKLAANYLSAAMANDVELSPAEAVKLVEQDQLVLVKQLIAATSVDKLESLLGPKVIKAIRDQGVKSIKDTESKLKPTPKPSSDSIPTPKADGSKPVKSESFFEQLRRKNGII